MSADKRWRLVCYDVRDPKRYRKVHKIIRGSGEPVQYSIFRCRLDDRESERLRWRLSRVMDSEDALLIVDLCPSCAHKVVSRNHVEGWSERPPPFRIVGSDSSREIESKDRRVAGARSGRSPRKAAETTEESQS